MYISYTLHDLIAKLHDKFSLKILRIPEYFLGIKVHNQSNESTLLKQSIKVHEGSLAQSQHDKWNRVYTPMFSHYKLSKHGSYVLYDPTMYRFVLRALQYVTLTWPDIAFCVNKACQFMSPSLESHWILVKWILRYLSGTITHGLLLSPVTNPN